MPGFSSGKVLVTGANGYIGLWVVHSLLKAGYRVRAVVRSVEKTGHLREQFAAYNEELEYHFIPDMTRAGAYDEAVKGVDAIIHTASPVHYNAVEADDIVVPALYGTLRVLEAALAYGPAIKRIVITSSVAAIVRIDDEPHHFTELDWNQQALDEIRDKGRGASQADKYRASKVFAERAAWEFVQEHQDEIGWDIVVLNPPYVFGPVLYNVDTPENLNASMLTWWEAVYKEPHNTALLGTLSLPWIDVRDLGEAHRAALETLEAGGERVIICKECFKWQDWINAVNKYGGNAIKGDTTYDPAQAIHKVVYDNSKGLALFGIQYRSINETAKDIVEQFKQKGWIPVSGAN